MPSVPTERHRFQHEGRTVYEWEQTFSEVSLFIEVPPGVRAKQLEVIIGHRHLLVGIKGNPPYLDVSGDGRLPAVGLRAPPLGEAASCKSPSLNWPHLRLGPPCPAAEGPGGRRQGLRVRLDAR